MSCGVPNMSWGAQHALGDWDITHGDLGVLLGLRLESLLAGGQATGSRGKGAAGDEGGHLVSRGCGRLLGSESWGGERR